MTHRILLAALAAAIVTTAPAAAQAYDASIGYGGGAVYFSDFNSGSGSGESLRFDPGWVVNAHVEHWMNRGRLGGRINGAFTQRPLDSVADQRDISTWVLGADLLLRLLSPSPGRSFAPFIAAGIGYINYGLGEGDPVSYPGADARYPGDDEGQLTVSGGFAVDIVPDSFTILGSSSGFRLEILDHVALESPFTSLSGSSFDPVHNIRVSLSLIGWTRLIP